MEREKLNHQAYEDVLDRKAPSMIADEYYMECYKFWKSTILEGEDEIENSEKDSKEESLGNYPT